MELVDNIAKNLEVGEDEKVLELTKAAIRQKLPPQEILDIMTEIGARVKNGDGWVRTGHCKGADQAFSQGASKSSVVYLPWENFNAKMLMHTDHVMSLEQVRRFDREAHKVAMHSVYKYHPAYKGLGDITKKMLAVSYLQILGLKGKLVDAVVCWTENYKNGRPKGVASQTVRIAEDCGIPVINLSIFISISRTPRPFP